MPTDPKPPLNATLGAFGERVRVRRRELGLSQEAAAEACGVHWTYLSQIERGQRSPRLENLLKIADGLGCQPGELVDELAR